MNKNIKYKFLFVLLFCLTILTLRADTTANSVTDFSSVQGSNNWFYGYWDKTGDADGVYASTDFQLMTNFVANNGPNFGGTNGEWVVNLALYFTGIWNNGQHPNGLDTSNGRSNREVDSVRRWISPITGNATITLHAAKDPNFAVGDGVTVIIFINGIQTFSQDIPGSDTTGFNVTLTTNVTAGTTVDFMLTPGEASDDHSDLTLLTATLSVVDTSGMVPKLSIQPAVSISWPTVSGTQYQLQSSSLLNSNAWTNFGPVIQGDGSVFRETDLTSNNSGQFYRLIIVP